MNYVNVFDATKTGWAWQTLSVPIGIGFVGLFFGVYLHYRKHPQGSTIADWAGSAFGLLFGLSLLLTCIFIVIGFAGGCKDVARMMQAGNYRIAEGVIHNYVAPWPGGNGMESFMIGSVQFRYSSGGEPCTFNYTLNNGFIHDGVRARVIYRDTDIYKGSGILKIDVFSSDSPQVGH